MRSFGVAVKVCGGVLALPGEAEVRAGPLPAPRASGTAQPSWFWREIGEVSKCLYGS